MKAGLTRLTDAIELSKTHRTRVVAFADSLSLLMALSAGPAVVEGAMPRRICDLILHIVRLRGSGNFQFVFSHRGVPRNETEDKAAEQGNAKSQSYPAWICDVVTGVERHVRNEMYRAFEEGRMPRTHHKHATAVKRKMKDGTVQETPLLQRSLQCPCCPTKCALKQCLTMRLQAKHGQPRREAVHNSLKVECRESAAHLLARPSLRELRKKHGMETLKSGELFFSAQLGSFMKELFRLESPSAHTPDEPETMPTRAAKRHCSPTALDTVYFPSAAAKLIVACTARDMRKRVREADSSCKAICFNVPLCEARMGSGLRSTSPAGFRSQESSRESSAARAE
ncbi:hypothetical protein ERJ75_000856000 [Trypanosoma vivax]|nr:hypothetical protein ERJ75_000856000 [Trypanosoma vivax]